MHVVFLHGMAAVGKFTVGTELGKITGLPLFHNHLTVDLALTLFDFGTEDFNALRATVWQAAFAQAAAADRSFIFTFSPDATVSPDVLDAMLTSVTSRGGKVFFVELHCPTKTLIERVDTPQRARFGKLTDPDLYHKVLGQGGFDFPALPKALIRVNTANHSPQEAAQSIALALEQALA